MVKFVPDLTVKRGVQQVGLTPRSCVHVLDINTEVFFFLYFKVISLIQTSYENSSLGTSVTSVQGHPKWSNDLISEDVVFQSSKNIFKVPSVVAPQIITSKY